MRHRDKFDEASFHLQKMEESFRAADGNYLHYFNSFLSSAQSVFFCLNKEFNKHPLYENWQKKRSTRLPDTAKVFKELRNVSEKEGPIQNAAVIVDFALKDGLPAHATFTSPIINSRTGQPVFSKGTITTKDGVTTEVEAVALHDFLVVVKSDKKTYRLDRVICDARLYAKAIFGEIEAAEKRFMKPTS
jgi:hypothetical protein